jgi:type III pantothenate kinase
MNLVFDIGNTSTKLGIYDRDEKIAVFRTKEMSCEELQSRFSGFHPERAIISSVKVLPEFIIDLLKTNIPEVHILSHNLPLPFTIDYDTPETLGSDRIAAAAGAHLRFPGSDILIIDAGTAITFDFLSGNEYKGGNISPGISMRFMALNKFTGKLPLIKKTDEYNSPGKSTREAIIAGVLTGINYEINEYIRTFEVISEDLKVIVTGGDGNFLRRKIYFKHYYMPDLVIDGLNNILKFNAK